MRLDKNQKRGRSIALRRVKISRVKLWINTLPKSLLKSKSKSNSPSFTLWELIFVLQGMIILLFLLILAQRFQFPHNLKSLINEPKCFKSVDNQSCIDLILTKHPKCFQNFCVFQTGISDFHKSTFTVLQRYVRYNQATFINKNRSAYWNWRLFCMKF